MSTPSFVRAGGLAGVLLAITSLVSVVVYFALVPSDQRVPIADAGRYITSLAHDATGTLLFNGLYALIALWAAIGIAAVYFRVRAAGEGWAFFATLVGEIAAVGTIAAGLYQVASLRYIATLPAEPARLALDAPSPINPLGVMTFGLTGIWFLLVSLLFPRAGLPRLLAGLGLVAFADLAVGFAASVAAASAVATGAALIAGVVGGPAFWLWLGVLLRRDAAKMPSG